MEALWIFLFSLRRKYQTPNPPSSHAAKERTTYYEEIGHRAENNQWFVARENKACWFICSGLV